MKIIEIDGKFGNMLKEFATVGSTCASNIAQIPGTLWTGPIKGEYPYCMPDYDAVEMEKIPLRLGQAGAIPTNKPSKKKKKKSKN